MRELALAGAERLVHREGGADREAALRRLADAFADPAHAGLDREALRDGKRRAWRSA